VALLINIDDLLKSNIAESKRIEINIRPDCIEVLSFPGPLPPIDNEMLKKNRIVARDYRNSRIGDFLKELKLTEGRGTGIPKIRRHLMNNGSPEALFETDEDRNYFLVTFKPHPEFPVYSTAEGQVTTEVTTEVTNETRLLSIMAGEMSRKEISEKLNLKNQEHLRKAYLSPALEQGLIEMTIPDKPNSRLQKYRLTALGKNVLKTIQKEK
jgi:ATP-dependent DNA helicase RecG